MKKTVVTIRVILWAGLLFVSVFFLWKGLGLGGEVVYSTDFKDGSGMISKLSPRDRLTESDDRGVEIIGNPVYFSLQTPRQYSKAFLSYDFKNKGNPKVETGLLVDGTLWRHKLKPLENSVLNKLIDRWDEIRNNKTILLQKNKKYETVESFLSDLPKRRKIALYNYDLDTDYIIDDYKPTSTVQKISTPLRGSYEFYTYIKNESLQFDFDFKDLNMNDDKDPVDLNLYYKDKLISSKHLSDDGVGENTEKEGNPGKISLDIPGLPEGVYKIELRVNDDIVTKEIITPQKKLSFAHKIRIFKDWDDVTKIYTDSNKLQSKIIKPGNLQKVLVESSTGTSAQEALDINETFKQFEKNLDGGSVYKLSLKKGGITLTGDGCFSLKEKALLNPSFKKVNGGIFNSEVEYVLAKYEKPVSTDGWTKAATEFDLESAYRGGDKYGFIISVPGMKVDDNNKSGVLIKNVQIKLKGKSLIDKIKDFFN